MVLRLRRETASLWLAWLAAALLFTGCALPVRVADPLPSWNDGPAKAAIVRLVQDTTRAGSADAPGKATGIDHAIGRIPIAAFGNSDGDLAMLETTTNSAQSRERPRLGALVWHTDAVREYAYDRDTHAGRLNAGLDAAPARGWKLLDMKTDWKVFPFELAR